MYTYRYGKRMTYHDKRSIRFQDIKYKPNKRIDYLETIVGLVVVAAIVVLLIIW